MNSPSPISRAAFTLVEVLAVIVIVGAVASATAPIILALSDSYATARDQRIAADTAGAAMERIVRLVREAPETIAGSGAPDITAASATTIEFASGERVELTGTTLWLTVPGEAASPLASGVSVFNLSFLGHDGVTNTMASPQSTQRVDVRFVVNGLELRSSAFIRIARAGA